VYTNFIKKNKYYIFIKIYKHKENSIKMVIQTAHMEEHNTNPILEPRIEDIPAHMEEHDTNPIPEPRIEDIPALIANALIMTTSLNNTSIYTFEFISGTHVGTFIRTVNDYMLIQVEGSGTVFIPLCWLKSVEDRYIMIQM